MFLLVFVSFLYLTLLSQGFFNLCTLHSVINMTYAESWNNDSFRITYWCTCCLGKHLYVSTFWENSHVFCIAAKWLEMQQSWWHKKCVLHWALSNGESQKVWPRWIIGKQLVKQLFQFFSSRFFCSQLLTTVLRMLRWNLASN